MIYAEKNLHFVLCLVVQIWSHIRNQCCHIVKNFGGFWMPNGPLQIFV